MWGLIRLFVLALTIATAAWLSSASASLPSANAAESRSFNYDANSRLVTANGPRGTGSYVYDALGNIRNRTEGSGSVSVMNYNASNRVSTATIFGQNRTFAYDARHVTSPGV